MRTTRRSASLAVNLPTLPLMTGSPMTQSDGHQSAAREARREEPAGVGNVDQGPDHNHRDPKQAQPTFHGDSVNSDARMYSHRQFLQGGLRKTGRSTPWPAPSFVLLENRHRQIVTSSTKSDG